MLKIEPRPWAAMIDHGRACFPHECCGILLGTEDADGARLITEAVACRNVYEGDQKDRFELDVKDILDAERGARQRGISVLGFFHSHPNEDAYFSATDLKNSAPGYSNVVMSIRDGQFAGAKSFIADFAQTHAEPEELHYA
jgi:proteasome lid subunit RPN8/RPN11